MIARAAINTVLAAACLGAAAIAWRAADREPPSYAIAAWVMSDEITPGGTISARFIFVRHRLCAKRVEQSIEQGVAGQFPLPAHMIEMPDLGLDVLTFEERVPADLLPGKAAYVASFIWRCPGNIIHWFRPLIRSFRIPIEIDGRDRRETSATGGCDLQDCKRQAIDIARY
jgi:hypothetical protein